MWCHSQLRGFVGRNLCFLQACMLAGLVEATVYGALEILVNNAGVYDVKTAEGAVTTLNINFYGVKFVTKSILPLLRESEAGARIVTVSSRAGLLEHIGKDSLRQTLENVDKTFGGGVGRIGGGILLRSWLSSLVTGLQAKRYM